MKARTFADPESSSETENDYLEKETVVKLPPSSLTEAQSDSEYVGSDSEAPGSSTGIVTQVKIAIADLTKKTQSSPELTAQVSHHVITITNRNQSLESRIISSIQSLFIRGGMYFSYDYGCYKLTDQ